MYTSLTDKNDLSRDLWIEVDLAAIAHNMRIVRRLSRSGQIAAVVKADGYGHGAVAVARTLLENGADRFAVATPDEAFELRDVFESTPILILGEVDSRLAVKLAENNIALTVTSVEKLRAFADRLPQGRRLTVHLKVDTGMGRLGCEPTREVADAFVEAIAPLQDRIALEGIFSHFAVADEEDKRFSHLQAQRFLHFVEFLAERGIEIPVKHMANSAAIIDLPEYHFDMVRAGILLFGMTPTGESLSAWLERRGRPGEVERRFEAGATRPDFSRGVLSSRNDDTSRNDDMPFCPSLVPELIPALSLKSRASFVKRLSESMGIGYGLTHRAEKGTALATVPAGYADGISRLLSGKIEVLIGGRRCRQVGSICMDQLMVEAHEGVQVGDEIVIIGAQGSERIAAEDLARKMGTLNYEIICMLSKRIPRVYVNGADESGVDENPEAGG